MRIGNIFTTDQVSVLIHNYINFFAQLDYPVKHPFDFPTGRTLFCALPL